MSTDFIYKNLTYKIIGALFEVHNNLGPVHKKNIYHEAIKIEFKFQGISFVEEKALEVKYKGQKIGVYRPDFIIDDKVILEMKAVPILAKTMVDQMYYYVRGSKYKLALLANFGTNKLIIKRRIYT
ncbi:MAG: GxxExxY protein [Candidatus Omnitrophica bacterium]|nr:GxxExxY protein [Candidatus Omnitrophota bacterium]